MGWQDAICHLGLTEFEDRLEAAWDDERMDTLHLREPDRKESLEILRQAAADPLDASHFDIDGILPIIDAAETLAWMKPWQEQDPDPEDSAADFVLSDRELDWLGGFLDNELQPPRTMSLEMLDGVLAALAALPDALSPDEYMPLIWGDNGEKPVFEDDEQAGYVSTLIKRHVSAIAARIAAVQAHAPVFDPGPQALRGVRWSEGFTIAVLRNKALWKPAMQDRRMATMMFAIAQLSENYHDRDAKRLSEREREEYLDLLVAAPAMFSHFFRHGPISQEPLSAAKTGRNDPCPCGSGKKYKKCHGGPDAPSFH